MVSHNCYSDEINGEVRQLGDGYELNNENISIVLLSIAPNDVGGPSRRDVTITVKLLSSLLD